MRVEEKLTINAPSERVWPYVTEPAHARAFLASFSRWDVAGEQESGLGARYTMRLEVGSAEIDGLVEVVEFDPPRDMAWNSISGIDHRGRWRLRERAPGCTEVTLRLSYRRRAASSPLSPTGSRRRSSRAACATPCTI